MTTSPHFNGSAYLLPPVSATLEGGGREVVIVIIIIIISLTEHSLSNSLQKLNPQNLKAITILFSEVNVLKSGIQLVP